MGSCFSFSEAGEDHKREDVELPDESYEMDEEQHHDERKKDEHSMVQSSARRVWYKNHPRRKKTARYAATHRLLCHKMDYGCFICGKTKNEVALESHHFYSEWAAQNGIDWIKFGQNAVLYQYHDWQTGKPFGLQFDWNQVQKDHSIFVDSPQNMMVLCPKHHRDRTCGIHATPFDLFLLQQNATYEVITAV
jgi:hypothetical protein